MMVTLAQDGAGLDWAHEFRPFTALHWVTTGVCAGVIGASAAMGVLWRGTDKELRLRASWAFFVLALQAMFVTYYMWPPFDIAYSLPLHICDLAGWIAGFALLTGKRWLRSMLYYWGICLSTQAFITPVLNGPHGYATKEFWAFFGLHLIIVGSAVYDLVVLRFRPTWADFRTSATITTSYAVTMFFFNWKFDTNYVYLGPTKPENPTILDHLGEWPWRPMWVGIIVASGLALFTAVWPSAWRRSSSPNPPASPTPNA